MAQRRDQLDREKLCCPICLDLLKDPVTIPCGHSYCMNCIKSYWDGCDQIKLYNCPYCGHNFKQRPVLMKNTMLADLVEEQKKTGLQAAPADHYYAGPGDVSCDVCTGIKLKAIKSCLQCLVSYCEQHLQPHYESPAFEKHKLADPSKELQENICSRHNEVMKIFCRTDQQCICYLCSMEEHKDHNIVSAAAEMTKRQVEIGPRRKNMQQRIQDREKQVKVLQQEVEAISRAADKAVEDTEKMSTELVCLIKKRSSDVQRQIRSQERVEVNRAKELQKNLEEEIDKLRRKDAALETLSHTEDQMKFLHNYSSLSRPIKSTIFPRTNSHPLRYFEDVKAAVSEAKGKLKDSYRKAWNKISVSVTEVDVLLPQDPKRRAELSQYVVHKNPLKLDPNTANMRLLLSEENRKATSVIYEQLHFTHPGRFIDKSQVLSRKPLTGRCYWEVQWSGLGVSVAVTYNDIARTGDESTFGNNDKSWVLECFTNGNYNFKHNSNKRFIQGSLSSRVGVFLDHRAGILSFYRISKTITRIHRVETTFTQPLYAGLGVLFLGSTVEFCHVK